MFSNVSCANKFVRRNMFKPNRLLVNLVEKIQPAGPSDVQPEKEELSCLRYQQKFCYFWEIPFDML